MQCTTYHKTFNIWQARSFNRVRNMSGVKCILRSIKAFVQIEEILIMLLPVTSEKDFFVRVALVWADVPLLGFCPTLMVFLFSVTWPPVCTASEAEYLQRGMVTQGSSIYSFILVGSFSFISPGHLAPLDTTLPFFSVARSDDTPSSFILFSSVGSVYI